MISWISESEALPVVGQQVLLARPRPAGEFWDIAVRCLLVRHAGVVPYPVKPGGEWPTDYFWGSGRDAKDSGLVTGNAWWASMVGMELPLGAEHQHIRGYDCVAQIGQLFIPQRAA